MSTESGFAEIVRKAVELADGWFIENHHGVISDHIRSPSGYITTVQVRDELLDALAVQLVRQVDETTEDWVETRPTITVVHRATPNTIISGPDRTMNTIRAIVESGVLE